MKNKNMVLAVIAGVVTPCLGLAIASAAALLIYPEPNKSLIGALFASLFAMIFSIPAVLLYGLPLFLLLRKYQRANIFTCVLVALAPILFAALYPPMGASTGKLLTFSFFFLVSALGFWFFARRTLPITAPNQTLQPTRKDSARLS